MAGVDLALIRCSRQPDARSGPSQIDLAADAADAVAADPERRAFARDADATGAAETGALCSQVAFGRPAGADQPLAEAGVEAAGDRVFVERGTADEAAHFERALAARRMRADDADGGEALHARRVGLEREHGRRRIELEAEPVRSVLQELRSDDVAAIGAERRDDGLELIRSNLGARERRRRERRAHVVDLDAHQADAALLNDLARRLRPAAALAPRMTAAERRMAGERELAARREDAHAVVGARLGRREQEGR